MDKQDWLDFAEVTDALRIIPRILLALAWTGFSVYVWWTTGWYMGLETPGAWDMTFITGTISSLGTALALLTNKYFDSGRPWGKQ